MPNWWSNQRLTREPCEQLSFESTGRGRRRHTSHWQPAVLCESFNRILTQSKKLCNFPQLQPSIRTTCHPRMSSSLILYPCLGGHFRDTQTGPEAGNPRFVYGPVAVA